MVSDSPQNQTCAIRYDSMPLAIYREVAAHLQSLVGVDVTLQPNPSTTFHYEDSQVGSLIISYRSSISFEAIQSVLDFYGPWQISTASPHER